MSDPAPQNVLAAVLPVAGRQRFRPSTRAARSSTRRLEHEGGTASGGGPEAAKGASASARRAGAPQNGQWTLALDAIIICHLVRCPAELRKGLLGPIVVTLTVEKLLWH